MHRREFLLSAAGIVGATTVGSIAYTNATVERDVSSDVSEDANAVIGLEPGSPSAVTKDNGKLAVDTTVGSASGLNIDSTFTYGSTSSPTSTYGFKLTNNDGSDQTIELSLTDGSGGDLNTPGSSSFEIHAYDSGGSQIGTASASSNLELSLTTSAPSAFCVIEIDTTGMSDGSSISGKMQFTTPSG